MKITAAQLNPVVGDIEGNLARVVESVTSALKYGADLVVFPELFLTGYPPRDLLERDWFIERVEEGLGKVAALSKSRKIGILIGAPVRGEKGLYNAALLFDKGEKKVAQHKSLLPTYDVFDEARYFHPADSVHTVEFRGSVLGVTICEDAWNLDLSGGEKRYGNFDPVHVLADGGADLFINISASPFTIGKEEIRNRLISGHASRHGIPFLYVNQVGSNDEIIFDGRSFLADGSGRAVCVFPSFTEHVETVETGDRGREGLFKPMNRIESVFRALVLGTGDYMRKSGFSKAVVGLSGGIDSAVTACVARDAVGKENVLGISMPSPYSSKGSRDDAKVLAENLGIAYRMVEIGEIYESYLHTLEPHFEKRARDVTEENIQARIRGNILMGFSNKFGYLVLATGNKSEMSVGYCTLYGDMSGGLAVISDVPKTMVYEVARYINRNGEVIPEATIEKAPSAELRPGQTDQDTLPPYDVLDGILYYHVEEGMDAGQIAALGFDEGTVNWTVRAVARNEYKRKQAAPGLKVTSKAFGVGRRIPIAARYTQ